MRVHGVSGWTPTRRVAVATALIDQAQIELKARRTGAARVMLQKARKVLNWNADLLEACAKIWATEENKPVAKAKKHSKIASRIS